VARITGFKDLIAWQKSMDLVESVYRLSAEFPAVERFGLTSQLRRAAVSIPANIAEGYGRTTRVEYVRFLDIARGSANEVETQLLIAVRLLFTPRAEAQRALDLCLEVQRILVGLVASLEASSKSRSRQQSPL
jgi:four helix bundle protein